MASGNQFGPGIVAIRWHLQARLIPQDRKNLISSGSTHPAFRSQNASSRCHHFCPILKLPARIEGSNPKNCQDVYENVNKKVFSFSDQFCVLKEEGSVAFVHSGFGCAN